MQRFWWVNHKQTIKQEVAGNYLWSPKAEANGARSQFYDNLRRASPGDFVISFANTRINKVGVVTDFALSAPKPDEFGKVGKNWSAEGWLLPVDWKTVSEVQPKKMLSTIASLLPEKYSPIRPETGNGNQKAYLTEISSHLFDEIATAGRFDRASVTFESSRDELLNKLESDVQASIENDSALSETEKVQLIKARRGQGIFRRRLFEIEHQCWLTGVENPSLLLASHIKPWRSCLSSYERLDGFNGLLLTPHVDRLFDYGLISISDDGGVMLSSQLSMQDFMKLGLSPKSRATPLHAKQKEYLAYHRTVIFLT